MSCALLVAVMELDAATVLALGCVIRGLGSLELLLPFLFEKSLFGGFFVHLNRISHCFSLGFLLSCKKEGCFFLAHQFINSHFEINVKDTKLLFCLKHNQCGCGALSS